MMSMMVSAFRAIAQTTKMNWRSVRRFTFENAVISRLHRNFAVGCRRHLNRSGWDRAE